MASDPRVEQVLALLSEINAADVAEDAAFQLQINGLSSSLATVTAERDALVSERDALVSEKATTLVELRAILNSLASRIAVLETA